MRTAAILAVVSLLLIIPIVSDSSDADYVSLKLSAVYPTETFEGFAITNYGSPVDMKGYTVTDGEGTVSFTSSFMIYRYETVYFCKSEVPSWFEMDRVFFYGNYGITMKGFALADAGDDIYLMKDESIIDSFVYGTVKEIKGGWNGEPFQKISKKHIALRTSLKDTDSSADWTDTTPGRTNLNQTSYDAMVTPFSFPDDYLPLFDALQDAKNSIDISIYLISHPKVISCLIESLDNGVKVRILIEGSPAGGVTSQEIRALKTLESRGAEIRVMKQIDGYRAYSFIHNKYAVIDSTKTIITSENWQESSFSSNRGWGVVVKSPGFAFYMENVFEADYNRQIDVVEFNSLFPTAQKDVYERYQKVTIEKKAYKAMVQPVVSPDYSYNSMRSFILSAKERVYSEQLEVDYYWLESNDNPISWMKTVSGAADCRLLVDVTFDDRNDGEFTDGYGVIDYLSSTQIQAKSPEFSGMSHNKGTIVDDKVWIGSINWTYTSFNENREVAVIVESVEVADYYSDLFLKDWGEGTAVNKENDETNVVIQNRGSTFLMEITNPSDSMIYMWDLDGDGSFETEGYKVIREFTDGRHEVFLSIDDGVNIRIVSYQLVSVTEKEPAELPMKYYPIIIICVLILGYNIICWMRRAHDSDKRVHERGHR